VRHSRVRDYLSASPVYIFHHIPKCGGTSVRNALSKWFHIVNDYLPAPDLYPEEAKKYIENPLDISKLKGRHLLCGHFETDGVHLAERYPTAFENASKYKIFSILRDPLEHRISHYYHMKQTRSFEMPPLEYWLTDLGDNLIARVFTCTKNDYRQILNRYFYIGFAEELQDSLDKLALLLHKKKVDVPNLNRMKRDAQPQGIDAKIEQRFREANQLDFRMYDYAKEKFSS